MDVISTLNRRAAVPRVLAGLLALVITGSAYAAPPPPPPPPFPPGQADAPGSRIVVLIVDLDIEGTVTGVELEKSSGFPELDSAALDAATRWHFDPLQRDGKPIAGKARVPVSFPPE